MPLEIRVHFEGDRLLRQGFVGFFSGLQGRARAKRISIIPVACGAKTPEDFSKALDDHPRDLNLLLVDSEEPVESRGTPWKHLASRQENRIAKPKGVSDRHAHLMVQVMESWLLADKDALTAFYGAGFLARRLPKREDIENVPKSDVLRSLNDAAKKTKKQGYRKTQHAPKLLAIIDPMKVRRASWWCNRLFETIEKAIEAAG